MKTVSYIFTGLCCLVTLLGAYGLMYYSEKTHALESDTKTLQQKIIAEREHLYVLEAERAYLTRPARITTILSAIDDGSETLSAPTPDQFSTIKDIPYRTKPLIHKVSYKKQK